MAKALCEECPSYFDLMKCGTERGEKMGKCVAFHLRKFPSAKMPLEQLLSILPLIKPRCLEQ